jgi:NADPH:quinone reductase-like Zn-dependent oxidoreductase
MRRSVTRGRGNISRRSATTSSPSVKRRYKFLNRFVTLIAVALMGLGIYVSHDSPCGTAPPLPVGAATMKAWTYRCYGGPDVLKLEDLEKPAPADDEVLVKVRAASVNPLDWHYLRGEPYLARMEVGIGAPTDPRLGVDFSGTVESVGKDVKRFHAGDEVWGARNGAFAQYVRVREARNVFLKPANISFEQAAAVPIAAITALQGLRDSGKIKAGQKVLINGASGGVGTFAVQIAKSYGAEVTGV